MKILHSIRRAIARFSRSPGPAVGGGTVGTNIGLGQIEAAERQEFPPEEFAADENEESES